MAFPTGWQRVCEVVIPSAGLSGALTDHPVTLTRACLPDEMCSPTDANAAQADGGDIRFSSDEAGSTRLPLHVVRFAHDTTDGAGDADVLLRVKVPSLSAVVDTSIWAWYNTAGSDSQPSASDTYGSQNAVESSRKGHWDLEESGNGTAGEYKDATATGAHGRGGNGTGSAVPTRVAGKVGYGQDFDGGDFIGSIGSTTDFKFLHGGGQLSVSAWVKFDNHAANAAYSILGNTLASSSEIGFDLLWENRSGFGFPGKAFRVDIAKGTASFMYLTTFSPANTITDNNWHKIGVTINAQSAVFYVDGVAKTASNFAASAGPSTSNATRALNIAENDPLNGAAFRLPGDMDQIAIFNTVRTAHQMLADYNNENNPAAFAIPGTPSGVGPTFNPAWAIGSNVLISSGSL